MAVLQGGEARRVGDDRHVSSTTVRTLMLSGACGSRQAIQDRHVEVHQDEVEVLFPGHEDSLQAVAGNLG